MAKTNKKYSRKKNSKRNTKRNSRRNTLRKYSHKNNNRSSRKTTLRKYSRKKINTRSSRKTTLRKYSRNKNNRSSRKTTLRKYSRNKRNTLRKYSRNKRNTLRKYSRNKRNTLRKYSRNKRNTLRKYSRNKIMRGGSLTDEEFQVMTGRQGVVFRLRPDCSPPQARESINAEKAENFKSSHDTINIFMDQYYNDTTNTFRGLQLPELNSDGNTIDSPSGEKIFKMGYLKNSDTSIQGNDNSEFSKKFNELTGKLKDIFPNYIEFVKNVFETSIMRQSIDEFGILKLGNSNKNGMVCLAESFMKKISEGKIAGYDNLEALHVDDNRAVLLPRESILNKAPPWSRLKKGGVINIGIKDSFKAGGKLLCDPGIEITSGTPDLEIQKKALLYLFKTSILEPKQDESTEIYFYCGYVKIENIYEADESYGWIKAVFINVYKSDSRDQSAGNITDTKEILFLPLFGTNNKDTGLSGKLPPEFGAFRVFKSIDKVFDTLDSKKVRVNEIRLTKNDYESLNHETLESLINEPKGDQPPTPQDPVEAAAGGGEEENKNTIRKFLLNPPVDFNIPEEEGEEEEGEDELERRRIEEEERERERRLNELNDLLNSSAQGFNSQKITESMKNIEREDNAAALKIMKDIFKYMITDIKHMNDRSIVGDEVSVINRFKDDKFYIKTSDPQGDDFRGKIINDRIIGSIKKITLSSQAEDLKEYLRGEIESEIEALDKLDGPFAKYYRYKDIDKNRERINSGFSSLGNDNSIDLSGSGKEKGDKITKEFEEQKGEMLKLTHETIMYQIEERRPKYEKQKRKTDIVPLAREKEEKLEKQKEEQELKKAEIELRDLESLNEEIENIFDGNDLSDTAVESITSKLDKYINDTEAGSDDISSKLKLAQQSLVDASSDTEKKRASLAQIRILLQNRDEEIKRINELMTTSEDTDPRSFSEEDPKGNLEKFGIPPTESQQEEEDEDEDEFWDGF